LYIALLSTYKNPPVWPRQSQATSAPLLSSLSLSVIASFLSRSTSRRQVSPPRSNVSWENNNLVVEGLSVPSRQISCMHRHLSFIAPHFVLRTQRVRYLSRSNRPIPGSLIFPSDLRTYIGKTSLGFCLTLLAAPSPATVLYGWRSTVVCLMCMSHRTLAETAGSGVTATLCILGLGAPHALVILS
jgi:hypothetical protein